MDPRNFLGTVMRRCTLAAFLTAVCCLGGCGGWTFPAGFGRSYTFESRKVGTGQQAITPTNDPWHENGESMNLRGR